MARKANPKRQIARRRGRPWALTANEWTLQTIAGLGKVVATTKECAAVLNVAEHTFIDFMATHPEARAAYDNAKGDRLVSLRRRQFKAADEGNATLLVWLGKQHLGQRDVDREHLPGGGNGPIIDLSTLTDEEIETFVALVRKLHGGSGEGAIAGPGGRAGEAA